MARERHEEVAAGPVTIAARAPSGATYTAVVDFKLSSLPKGSWHCRALTEEELELPAAMVTIDAATLEGRAEFPNPFERPVTVVGVRINLGDE